MRPAAPAASVGLADAGFLPPLPEEKPHYLGHRQRLRERLLNAGAAALPDYELLEFLLTAAQARGDLKPLAKKLIDHFHGFAGVLAADRRALAAQAVRAFASFEPEPGLKFDKIYEVYSQRFQREDFDEDEKFDPTVLPNSYLTDPKQGDAFVYVSTIQRMTINLFGRDAVFNFGDEAIEDDADKLDIPIHAFDIIIADECHRGYTTGELSTCPRV